MLDLIEQIESHLKEGDIGSFLSPRKATGVARQIFGKLTNTEDQLIFRTVNLIHFLIMPVIIMEGTYAKGF